MPNPAPGAGFGESERRSTALALGGAGGGLGALLHDALLELARLAAPAPAGLVVIEVLFDVLGQPFLLAALLEAAQGLREGLAITCFDTDHSDQGLLLLGS